MLVDWGDNSNLESIILTSSVQQIEHYFDSEVKNVESRYMGTPTH